MFSASSYEFLERAVHAREDRRHLIHKLDFRPLVSLKFQHHKDFDLHLEVLNGFYILDVCYHLQNVIFLIMDGIEDWSLPTRHDYLITGVGIEVPEEYCPRRNTQQTSSSASPNNPPANNRRPDALRHSAARQYKRLSRQTWPRVWSLKGCSNICGMRAACFESINTGALTFLDLSYTDHSTVWTQSFSDLPFEHLRILKLRGLHLTDSCLPKFGIRNGHKLWSVDLRENLLTDAAISSLSDWFLPKLPLRFSHPTVGLYRHPPTYHQNQQSSDNSADETMPHRSDTADDFLRHMAANPHVIENAETDPLLRHTGLTHLYLADNKITADGVRQLLLLTNRLHVLDVGISRDSKDTLFKSRHAVSWDHGQSYPSLGIANSYHLSSLRIHHSIITCMPTVSPVAGNEGITSPSTYSLRHLYAAEKLARGRTYKGTPGFTPMKNCIIETLILTGIPTKSYGFLIEKLISFLHACRNQERELANLRTNTHRRAPEVLPGLKTLRLEFLPPDTIESIAFAGRGSVSGDPDADVFSEASNEDFSFFTDNTERPAQRLSLDSRENSSVGQKSTDIDGPLKDVVEELKKARREAGENKWGGNLELVLPHIRG